MDKLYGKSETGCCPRFDPKPWTDTEVVWKDKLFVKDRVRTFLHIPINFGQVVVRIMKKIKEAGALADKAFSNGGRWVSEMKEYVKAKGREIKKLYFFYTTCPACAKYYGKNYVVALAKI